MRSGFRSGSLKLNSGIRSILLNLKHYKEASLADRWARRLGCAAVRDEGALRMRRTPLRVRAVREAADSTDERVCTHLVVPAPARRGR